MCWILSGLDIIYFCHPILNCKSSSSLGVASDFLVRIGEVVAVNVSTCLDGSSVSLGMSYFQVNESSHSDFCSFARMVAK